MKFVIRGLFMEPFKSTSEETSKR